MSIYYIIIVNEGVNSDKAHFCFVDGLVVNADLSDKYMAFPVPASH